MSRKKIKHRSEEYYNFIVGFARDNGRVPVLDEIMQGMGVKSRGIVHHHISNLVADGRLTKEDNGRMQLTRYRFQLVRDGEAVTE